MKVLIFILILPSVLGKGSCPSGWVVFGDFCYYISESVYSWDIAREVCQNRDADLASFNSKEEREFIEDIVSVNLTDFWIGLMRNGNTWEWSDGSVHNPGNGKIMNWGDGQPNGEGQCGLVNGANPPSWENRPCSWRRRFVCKKISTAESYEMCSPDEGWRYYGGRCYYFSGVESEPPAHDWYGARAWCQGYGGDLVSINDPETQSFIDEQITDINTYSMWTGLNELDVGGYRWSDGNPVDYLNWETGAPDDHDNQLCVTLNVQQGDIGKWRNRHCSQSFNFICTKNQGATSGSTAQPTIRPGGCPEGYEPFESKCFKFVDLEPANWTTAQQRCLNENRPYSLATISGVYENSFILSQLLHKQGRNYWLGLHQFESGKFYWADNSPVTYTNWAPGEPSGGDNEQCVHLYGESTRAAQWNDVSCETEMGYICMTYRDISVGPTKPPTQLRCSSLPGEWYFFNLCCYKMITEEALSWQVAEHMCEYLEGSQLASILSPYEQGFIHGVMRWYNDHVQTHNNVWIGLNNLEDTSSYRWSDGWAVQYTSWRNDKPDRQEPSCVNLDYSDGGWIDGDCNTPLWAICKHTLYEPTLTMPPASGQCPIPLPGESWIEYGNACYMFITEHEVFSEARHQCYIRGADLVSIHSKEENDFLYEYQSGTSTYHAWWTGLIKTVECGFEHTDGSAVQYFNWAAEQPSDEDCSQGELCTEYASRNFGRWSDTSCDKENLIICKSLKSNGGSTTESPPVASQSTPAHTSVLPSATPTEGQPPPGGMSPGGVVGLVFGLIFLALGVLAVVVVVMKRQGKPIPLLGI